MTEKKKKVKVISDPGEIADIILSAEFVRKKKYTLAYWHGDYYRWRDGCHYRMDGDDLDTTIIQHVQFLKDDPTIRTTVTASTVKNIRLNLQGRVALDPNRELNSWAESRDNRHSIGFRNGVLQYDPYSSDPKPLLKPNTTDFFNVVQLSFEYDPAAKCEQWISFLNDVLLDDQEYVTLCQEWLGYLIRPDLWLHKFLLFFGEGSNGKGVFSEIVEALIGKPNCSHVPLCSFGKEFALIETYGKLVNIAHESSHAIHYEAEAILKSFVAGDRFTFARKFKSSVEATPTAKVMISTNSLPRFSDKSQGIWRRIIPLPFNRNIPESEQDHSLAKKIKASELPGIFNWALQGLQSLHERGGFIVPKRQNQLLEEYRTDSNPALAFLKEYYVKGDERDAVMCSAVYGSYTAWCAESNFKPLSASTFGREVSRLFPYVEKRRGGTKSNRYTEYIGLVSMNYAEAVHDVPEGTQGWLND